MDINIEIGTEDQKRLILKELQIIEYISKKLNLTFPISEIIVANNFDEKINEKANSKNYTSRKIDNQAIGKNIFVNNQIILVFSPIIYTDSYDYQTRLQLYLHELFHAINKTNFPDFKSDSRTNYQALSNLYILYGEYYADRKSFSIFDKFCPKLSKHYKKFQRNMAAGFVKSLGKNDNYVAIQQVISNFRVSKINIDLFLDTIIPYFDDISKTIIHSFSFLDHFPRFKRFIPFLNKSKFINEKTYSLIEFYRKKYKNNNFDLSEGIKIMETFLENFGMKFEDVPQGVYCRVLDI